MRRKRRIRIIKKKRITIRSSSSRRIIKRKSIIKDSTRRRIYNQD